MHATSILAFSGLLSMAAAVPYASARRHQHHQRAVVWETVTEEVIETVAVTKTIWLEPGQSPPAGYTPPVAFTPAAYTLTPHHSSAQAPKYTPPAPAPASSAPAASSPVAPPAPPAVTPSSSYVAPAPAPTSSYVPPPAPVTPSSSSYVAPAPSASAPSTGGGSGFTSDMSLPADAPSGLTYGMGAAGTSYTGDLTYYQIGMGACGWTNTEDEAVVAISHDIFDSYNDNGNPNANPLCGKFVTIIDADGNKRYHQIVDRCVGCDSGSLDLPEGFFNSITVNGNGRVSGVSWSFT